MWSIMGRAARGLLVTALTVAKPVSMLDASHLARPSPKAAASGSFSRVVPPPQSAFSHISRRATFEARHYLPGFLPSSRCNPWASTRCGGFHPSAMFRPQAFSASRRFAPPTGVAGLFRPADHVQGSIPFRGFSLGAGDDSLGSHPYPHAVADSPLPARLRSWCPRLAASTSRSWSAHEARSEGSP